MAKDVKNELEAALDTLAGKGKGAKGKPPRGLERKKMWEEVRALRKECVSGPFFRPPKSHVQFLGTDSVKEVLLRPYWADRRSVVFISSQRITKLVSGFRLFWPRVTLLAGDSFEIRGLTLQSSMKQHRPSKLLVFMTVPGSRILFTLSPRSVGFPSSKRRS